MARTPTTSREQRKVQNYWTTGARLRAAGDGGLIQGINEQGGHQYQSLDMQGREGIANLRLADSYIAYANQLLTGHAGQLPKGFAEISSHHQRQTSIRARTAPPARRRPADSLTRETVAGVRANPQKSEDLDCVRGD